LLKLNIPLYSLNINKNDTMIITKGSSAKKEHLSNGATTACNFRTSGIGKNEFDSFKWLAENHPEVCCEKCLNRFIEKSNRIKK
jgi:hypothetical protein